MQKEQTAESFWAKVDKSGDCWEWRGFRLELGYGQVSWQGKLVMAHRIAFMLTHGPIPKGLHIHHKCRNRVCCNPAHLEALTAKENVLLSDGTAATNARKTHCNYGHPYDDKNTYINTRGSRECRTCRRNRIAKHLTKKTRVENRIW